MEPVTKNYLFELLIAVVVTLILLLGVSAIHTQKCHEKEMKLLREINAKIAERDARDASFHEHLSNCSFLDRDQVYVNHNGYVKSHYNHGYAASQK